LDREHKHRLVEQLQEGIAAREIPFHLAYWDSQVEATPDNDRRRAEAELELRRYKGDPEALRAVQRALDDDLHEPKLKRQLEVLRLTLTANQMDEPRRAELVELSSAVEGDFTTFRAEADGRRLSENDIIDILRTSDDDADRRSAWEASKQIGPVVAERVRELARLRNSVARDLGYADHYAMALALQELDEGWLFATLGELERLTERPFKAYKRALDDALRRRFGIDEVMPWHYSDPFFQMVPMDGRVDLGPVLSGIDLVEATKQTFAALGIDISGALAKSDLYPREGKSQHAFCLDIDRSGEDVRILANIVPGEYWAEVILHESGHAAYDLSIDHRVPYLLHRPAHTFVTESIALLCGRLIREAEWLARFGGLAGGEARALEQRLQVAAASQLLVFVRWGLVMVHFERALYSDPEADLDALWWELVERFQGVVPPPGRRAPDWATKIHLAVAPVYYHNYILGELVASQLRRALRERFGSLLVPAAGAWLRDELFAHGNLVHWDDLLRTALGAGPSPRALAADLAVLDQR
jgi:peptidyl-dipeptidase A